MIKPYTHLLHCSMLTILPLWFFLNEVAPVLDIIPMSVFAKHFLTVAITGYIAYFFLILVKCSAGKAVTISLAAEVFILFFGKYHDIISSLVPSLDRYSITIASWLILFAALCIIIRKKASVYRPRAVRFFFTVFAALILYVVYVFLNNRPPVSTASIFSNVPADSITTELPNFYFIIFDEWGNSSSLQSGLDFDQSPFEQTLTEDGFQVFQQATSSYDLTPMCISSLFNAAHPDTGFFSAPFNNFKLLRAWEAYDKVAMIPFLQQRGYSIYNFGIEELGGVATAHGNNFKNRLAHTMLFQNTLYGRISIHLLWNILKYRIPVISDWYEQSEKASIETTYRTDTVNHNSLIALLENPPAGPHFVFAHFMYPHYPFLRDSTGELINRSLLADFNDYYKEGYIAQVQYAQHTAKQISALVKELPANSYVWLGGDHGWRWGSNRSNAFLPFTAIYTNKDSIAIDTDRSIQHINLMRAVLRQSLSIESDYLPDYQIKLFEKRENLRSSP